MPLSIKDTPDFRTRGRTPARNLLAWSGFKALVKHNAGSVSPYRLVRRRQAQQTDPAHSTVYSTDIIKNGLASQSIPHRDTPKVPLTGTQRLPPVASATPEVSIRAPCMVLIPLGTPPAHPMCCPFHAGQAHRTQATSLLNLHSDFKRPLRVSPSAANPRLTPNT